MLNKIIKINNKCVIPLFVCVRASILGFVLFAIHNFSGSTLYFAAAKKVWLEFFFLFGSFMQMG